MFLLSLILLLVAMIFGSLTLIRILKNKRTNKPIVVLHGVFAGFGLLMVLTYIAMGHTSTLPIVGATFLGIAAVGGFIMFGIDISKKRVPKSLAIGHPILAVIGVLLLVYYAITTFA